MTGSLSSIVIVGLGPGDPESRTIGTQRALDRADRIILRTRIHPGIDDLASDPRVTDCDDLYTAADGFNRLYAAIAGRVLDAARDGGSVVFAVPGHPRVGERAIPLIEAGARELEIPVTVKDAVSFIDAASSALGFDPLADGFQVVDAEHLAATLDRDPFAAGTLQVDPARPLLVGQIYNSGLAAAVKIALARVYPDEHPVTLVRAAGVLSHARVCTLALHTLDRQEVDHLSSLWVPPQAALDAARSPESLTRVVAQLRGPDGCPWDREQTHASLRDSVLEEAYEVVEAIDSGDGAGLVEELGDLLLLVAMHAQIAEEEDIFRIEDVYEEITRKLIRRHPHVFGEVVAETPDAVVATWEGVKAAERKAKGAPQREDNAIDRLPRAMPATRKAMEILAPRVMLRPPEHADDGDDILSAVSALIDRGIDPERALEASLRIVAKQRDRGTASFAVTGASGGRGREEA